MVTQQPLEEPFSRSTITPRLKIDIHHIAILIHCSPQVVLLTIYLHKDFVDEEGIAIASVPSFQTAGINSSEFDAPEADRFSANSYASFG